MEDALADPIVSDEQSIARLRREYESHHWKVDEKEPLPVIHHSEGDQVDEETREQLDAKRPFRNEVVIITQPRADEHIFEENTVVLTFDSIQVAHFGGQARFSDDIVERSVDR